MKMKSNHPRRRVLAVGLGFFAVAVSLWLVTQQSREQAKPTAASEAGAASHHGYPSEIGAAALSPAIARRERPASGEPAPPVRFTFDALTQGRVPLRTEARMFQAQKWESDIAKALDLPPGTPLQRRSAIYHVPELKFPLVRVDRIYRMDRGLPKRAAGTAARIPSSVTLDPKTTPAQREALTKPASDPVPAEGGELLWDNAMIADHLMVQAQLGVSREQLQRVLPSSCRIQSAVSAEKGLYLVSIPHESERSLELAVLALNHESLKKTIWFAEPDFLMGGADTAPNDSLFTTSTTDVTKQWALPKIMAPRAWDVIKQAPNATIAGTTVVAVVDTGVDYTHPDLAPTIYVNPGESGGGNESNGLDDDGNGKIDDWRGWNFVENNNDPMDDVGHGTHVAGIIGAVGNNDNINGQNNTGVCGVCWGVKMLPLRIIKKLGLGTYGVYSDAVAAMDYMRTLNSPAKRVAVANHSWGGSGYSLAMLNAVNNPLLTADPLPDGVRGTYEYDSNTISVTGTTTELNKIKIGMEFGGIGIPEDTVITIINGSTLTLSNYARQRVTNQPVCFANPIRPKPYGIVHVAASGNSRFNADRIPTYPASLPSGFMMSVGASDVNDAPAIWSGGAGSNYGHLNVDIFAPGSNIWSTKWKAPGDASYGYENRNGTSMAAPFVAGSIALLKMWQPKLTDLQARQIVVDNVEVTPTLRDKCVGGGRLNLPKVVDKLYQPILLGSGGSTGGTGTTIQALNSTLLVSGKIASGTNFHLFIDQGRLFAWGSDIPRIDPGYQSTSLPAFTAVPTEVPGFDRVVMVAAIGSSVVLLRDDGTVWLWSMMLPSNPPSLMAGFPPASWIAVGGTTNASRHILATTEDGRVWAQGSNVYGQLGDGTTLTRSAPVIVPGLEDIIQVAAGDGVSLALDSDGRVWSWGQRSHGALGDGQTSGMSPVPSQVAGVADVAWVGIRGSYAMAVRNDGRVVTWGRFLGQKSSAASPVGPTLLDDIGRIVGGTIGSDHAVAIEEGGDLFAWGDLEKWGQLGNGSDAADLTPQRVIRPSGTIYVACSAAEFSTVAMSSDGDLRSWGARSLGQLGDSIADSRLLPVRIPNLPPVASIFADPSTRGTFAVSSDGDVFAWGEMVGTQEPVAWPWLSGVARLCGDYNTNFGLKTNGTLWAWGSGPDGELGVGHLLNIPRQTPEQVIGLPPIRMAVTKCGTNWAYNDPGVTGSYGSFTLAVSDDDRLFAWGANVLGQLGDGSMISRHAPAEVTGLGPVAKVAAGSAHVLALKRDGTVLSWGRNQFGQLGSGTTAPTATPQAVPGLASIKDVAASTYLSFALREDGTVWRWGANPFVNVLIGEFNYISIDSTVLPHPTPELMTGLPPIKAIFMDSARQFQAIAVDGSLWTAGSPWLNARHPGSTLPSSVPDFVVGVSGVAESSIHGISGYCATQDGSVFSWGVGRLGSLGDRSAWSNIPVRVASFGSVSSSLSTLGTGSPSDSWLLGSFSASDLTNANVVADSADPDGDGIANLMEYALGLDPSESNRSGLPTPRLDAMTAQSASEGAGGGTIQLFSVDDCCFATPVGLDAGKHYMAFTVERRGGIRMDIDYIIEVSNDLVTWRSSQADVLTVINTGELLEAYSTTPIENEPRQFMRLKVRRN